MSKVADEALRDAGYDRTVPPGRKAPEPRRIAVVVAMEIEPSAHLHLARYGLGDFLRRAYDDAGLKLTEEQFAALAAVAREGVHEPIVANEVLSYIGNIMASRISSLWNLTGPSFTVSSDGAGTAEALQIAQLLLLDESVEAVLVGAVDLAASPENLLLRDDKPVSGAGLSFGEGQRGRRIGEGAGAVVVTRPGAAPDERRAYARIDSVAVRHAAPVAGTLPEADADTLALAAGDALAAAGIGPADVGYVEAHAGGTPAQDAAELAALAVVYPAGSGTVALGSAKAQLGDTRTAAAMAGLLRAVLCLHHAHVPGAPGWRRPAPELAGHFAASAFHVPEASRPWLRVAQGVRRYAAVSAIGSDGAHAHVVLSADRTRGDVAAADWRKAGGPVLLPLGAPDLDGLLAEVDRHLTLLAEGADPYRLGRAAAEQLPGSALRVVLVGRDSEQLRAQLESAARDLPGAAAKGEEWTTPAGSCFAPRPIGPEGKVALVYPGAFNSYPGLGQDFFRVFPSLLDSFEAEASDPDRLFRAAQLYPRTQVTPERRDLMALEGRLGEDIPFMLATGTTFAILYTDLVRDLLGVRAHGAFGYSLGESSMLFATGGWRRSARRDDRISATPLFRDRLSGPRRTVRELWRLGEDTPDEAVWGSFVLLESADRITDALSRAGTPYDRVFLTHVNTPREAVIAGDPAQCRSLIAELDCPSARSPVGSVMHCPVVDGELAGLAELNDHPTGSPGGLDLLSAYDYDRVPGLERSEVARRIARTLRATIDFPRLVRTAYDRGYRYFVEVGPGATCTRWVHDTLGDAEHVAMPVDRRGVPAARSVAQLAARLAAHGLPVDLAALLGPDPVPAARPALLRVPVGGGASIPAGITARVAAASQVVAGAARPEPAHVGAAAAYGSTELASTAVDVKDTQPARAAADLEVPAPMPADPSLDDVEVITFDGEPLAFVPWAEPAAPTPAPAHRHLVPSTPGTPPPAHAPTAASTPAPPSGWSSGNAAADLVREIRQQMVATHSVVMETQRVLQENTLARTEALLEAAFAPAPAAAPTTPPPALPSGPPPPPPSKPHPRPPRPPGRRVSSGTRNSCSPSPPAGSRTCSAPTSRTSTGTRSASGCPHPRTTSSPASPASGRRPVSTNPRSSAPSTTCRRMPGTRWTAGCRRPWPSRRDSATCCSSAISASTSATRASGSTGSSTAPSSSTATCRGPARPCATTSPSTVSSARATPPSSSSATSATPTAS